MVVFIHSIVIFTGAKVLIENFLSKGVDKASD